MIPVRSAVGNGLAMRRLFWKRVVWVLHKQVYKFYKRESENVMHLGKDFWLIMKIIVAVIDALRKLFNEQNEDDNGEHTE